MAPFGSGHLPGLLTLDKALVFWAILLQVAGQSSAFTYGLDFVCLYMWSLRTDDMVLSASQPVPHPDCSDEPQIH